MILDFENYVKMNKIILKHNLNVGVLSVVTDTVVGIFEFKGD